MRPSISIPPAGPLSTQGIIDAFSRRMSYSVARDRYTATEQDAYKALAFSVRDQLVERWFRTQERYYQIDAKRVYYLSLEFLLGRTLLNNIINLGAHELYAGALEQIGYDLEALEENEPDAGLGNGGLGRLAACFLESAATVGLPFYGYGIRYEYGIFRQKLVDGVQIEQPDNWLRYGSPWEIPRADVLFPVKFYGRAVSYLDESGVERYDWVEASEVYAMAYDIPIAGFRNDVVNTLRLWAAKSSREFDLERFNAGEYVVAVEDKTKTENISKVLYPSDDQYVGKELRLKQQYFFVSATLQDLVRRFKKKASRVWDELPEKVSVQLNDTHPAVAIPELMRILVDQEKLEWEHAWRLTRNVFGFTNHTILWEALEVWPVEFFGRLLPRHLQIIREIDRRFRETVMSKYGTEEKVRKMAIIDERSNLVRMAHLAIVGSKSVNGVAKLHTHILEDQVFRDFVDCFPGRFSNKTNGINPRRWLLKANPPLAQLITSAIGDGWTRDLERLHSLERFAGDSAFRDSWREAKRSNKERLSEWARTAHDLSLDPDFLLDTQIKRIHEYKRQLLNAIHAIELYHRIADDGEEIVPRTILFGGKAAPAYRMAKLIIRLIHAVGEMIAGNPRVRERLHVVFLPNYDVSSAERLFPATELSQQISTAGTEASGTGNMKASLNGALIIGTMDGANIEIAEEIGHENLFVFGKTAEEIQLLRSSPYDPGVDVRKDRSLERAIATISTGWLAKRSPATYDPIVELLLREDRYFHCADFASYAATQRVVEDLYVDKHEWTRRSILGVARMGFFSSDRTIREYAREIWSAPLTNELLTAREESSVKSGVRS